MLQVFRYDKDGYFVEPVIITRDEAIPSDCTALELPQPCWKPKFNGVQWIETATEDEMNPPLPPLQPTAEEKLEQMEQDLADLWYSMMMGGLI